MKNFLALFFLLSFFCKAQGDLKIKLYVLEGKKTQVVESFQKEKSYTLCEGENKVSKIEISGHMDNVSFTIKKESDHKVIFTKTKLNLSSPQSFTQRDFQLHDGDNYTINISQGNKTIFEGTIASAVCGD